MALAVFGPQLQEEMVPPAVGVGLGVKTISLPRASEGRSVALVVRTTMAPALEVVTLRTYLVALEAALLVVLDSQPHALAAGKPEVEDCTLSVMEVRQAEAANTTSAIFARAV